MGGQSPAGWYADPERADLLRFWDGERWTEHTAPKPPQHPPPAQGHAGREPARSNGFAVAALAGGITGAVIGLGPAILYVIPLAAGVLAIVFGVLGRRRVKRDALAGRKAMATWGIALGVIALAFGTYGAVTVEDALNELDGDSSSADEAFGDEASKFCDAEDNEARMSRLNSRIVEAMNTGTRRQRNALIRRDIRIARQGPRKAYCVTSELELLDSLLNSETDPSAKRLRREVRSLRGLKTR